MNNIDISLIDWSRAQFALTAIYHWLFVPLTLGLAMIMAVMESIYVKTKDEFWAKTTRFWMRLFGINFAIGIATGLILEFEFGTNWSNYSWFVGDIFGAPLAIEGILAFFMEATFVAVMFFGWNKVSKKFHLTATWLTAIGAALSAWWILVANAWMQNPIGVEFNPDTVRNEMVSFWEIATSDIAVAKFFHTVLSGWVLGSVFVVGVSAWYLLKKRDKKFAINSIKIASIFGLTASLLSIWTGDISGRQIADKQPMKLAAIEGLYQGGNGADLTVIGLVGKDNKVLGLKIPKGLSFMATHTLNGFVPGINDIIDGGYLKRDGNIAISAQEKIDRGKIAIAALAGYRQSKKDKDETSALVFENTLKENMEYFGYGYIKDVKDLIPPVPLNFYAFRVMVILGCYFLVFFAIICFLVFRKDLSRYRWLQYVALWSIPFGYMAGQAGWIVTETGRQPWAIQDLLPVSAAVSAMEVGAVKTTFFIFLALFTVMLSAGITIMLKSIKKGPWDISEGKEINKKNVSANK